MSDEKKMVEYAMQRFHTVKAILSRDALWYCVDERHGTPCPLPCPTCDEECDPTARERSEVLCPYCAVKMAPHERHYIDWPDGRAECQGSVEHNL